MFVHNGKEADWPALVEDISLSSDAKRRQYRLHVQWLERNPKGCARRLRDTGFRDIVDIETVNKVANVRTHTGACVHEDTWCRPSSTAFGCSDRSNTLNSTEIGPGTLGVPVSNLFPCQGGPDEIRNQAKLVPWSHDGSFSAGRNLPVLAAAIKRQSSDALDEDVTRSTARLKRSHPPSNVETKFPGPTYDKVFHRKSDLIRHERSHSVLKSGASTTNSASRTRGSLNVTGTTHSPRTHRSTMRVLRARH